MIGCIDCSMLEVRLAAAGQRESVHLRELDQARDRLERSAESAGAPRHWTRIVCDRCGDAMEFSTVLASDEATRFTILCAAVELLGWRLSVATAIAIGAPFGVGDKRDLCGACCRALFAGETP